ncbi:hypothetical protein [Pseudoxanthomonas sp. 10H]|uniref:hypothetical protein n=1 Tax=Pseudoxanthomonas sp. 10H TaxID=3242729 RepID=UPI0035570606
MLLVLALPVPRVHAAPAEVTVYRCMDSRGQLVALRDSPCRPGERQEAVQMQRPQDPPPRTVSTMPAPAAPAASVREVRVVTVQAPQPLFECTAPDGTTYISETDQVTERWVPLWTLGYPVGPGPRPPRPVPAPRGGTSVGSSGAGRLPPSGAIVPAGTWVRDSCVRLTQQEVCTHLSDRRYEILRLYHAAMPSERNALDREQQQIDTRMANECPGY